MDPENNAPEALKRRDFLALTAATVAAVACPCGMAEAASAEHAIDAGPVSNYPTDGVYTTFRDRGFFLIRKDGKFSAIASMCTHRRCKINALPDHSFKCPCHGSTFTPDGKVTKGPAKIDLPKFTASPNEQGHVIVTVPGN